MASQARATWSDQQPRVSAGIPLYVGTHRSLNSMSETVTLADHLGRGQRIFVVGVGLVLVFHFVLLTLWLAPSSPVRDAVGSARLATYVDPYFQQGDETVGIGSNRVDEALELRAYVRPEGGGDPTFTPWIDVTASESRAVRGVLSSARSHQMARRLATNLNFSLFSLTSTQRQVVAKTTADVPVAELQRQLSAGAPAVSDVKSFMAVAQMATQFASLWLGAVLSDVEVLQVQYRVGRRVVPDYAVRTTQTLTSTDFDWFNIGWRRAFRADASAREAFTDYVRGVNGG